MYKLLIALTISSIFLFSCSNDNKEGENKTRKGNTVSNDLSKPLGRNVFWKNLPKPIGAINDFENLYSPAEELYLDSLVEDFRLKKDVVIVIVTMDTTATSADKFDALTLRIGNEWGIGDKEKDNGVLVGISNGHRMMRIQNGLGIEKYISNDETKRIVEQGFVPFFKNGQYFNGTVNGINEIIKLLNAKM